MFDKLTFDPELAKVLNRAFSLNLLGGFDDESDSKIHGNSSRFHIWDNLDITGTITNGVYSVQKNQQTILYIRIQDQKLTEVGFAVARIGAVEYSSTTMRPPRAKHYKIHHDSLKGIVLTKQSRLIDSLTRLIQDHHETIKHIEERNHGNV